MTSPHSPYIAASQRRLAVFIDVDGVVADFAHAILKRVGANIPVSQYNILSLMTPEQSAEAEMILDTPNFWSEQPVLPGAIEGVGKIALRHDIYWATCPWTSCIGWGHARRAWLKRHFGVSSEKVVILRDKGLVGGDVLIDDKHENLASWAKSNPSGWPFLFDAPHNAYNQCWTRINWNNLPAVLIGDSNG